MDQDGSHMHFIARILLQSVTKKNEEDDRGVSIKESALAMRAEADPWVFALRQEEGAHVRVSSIVRAAHWIEIRGATSDAPTWGKKP